MFFGGTLYIQALRSGNIGWLSMNAHCASLAKNHRCCGRAEEKMLKGVLISQSKTDVLNNDI